MTDEGRVTEGAAGPWPAVVNAVELLLHGGFADRRPTPSDVISEGRTRTLHRYCAVPGTTPQGPPVLLVPPLGAPAECMDLRRGCSLAEHLVGQGRPTYLVDYGRPGFAERHLGVEHWVSEVLPDAVLAASADASGRQVVLVGWCGGGIMSLLCAAGYPELPVSGVALVATPFDFSKAPILRPFRALGKYTGGAGLGLAARAAGGVPGWAVGPLFKLTALPTYVKKPVTLVRRGDDLDFLAHVEAVDALMNDMRAFPGRATLQMYLRILQRNELATGVVVGPNRTVRLAEFDRPLLSVAGAADVLVPPASAHHLGELATASPDVRLETAPGGHLGVLTGRAAAATTWRHIDDFLDDLPVEDTTNGESHD